MTPHLPPDRADKGLFWGEAWTLVDGCTPVSAGCKNCWAAAIAHRFQKRHGGQLLTTKAGVWTGKVYLDSKALGKPSGKREPTVYAVWNDLYHPQVPAHFIGQAWQAMRDNPQHTFIIITKRPKRATLLARYHKLTMLPNVWFLATTENQVRLNERAQWVLDFPVAAVRGVILEPLLEAVDITKWRGPQNEGQWLNVVECGYHTSRYGLNWVIVGAETGLHHRPCNLEWIRSVVKQCQAAEIPVWVKAVEVDGRIIKKTSELPEDVRFRELPEVRA